MSELYRLESQWNDLPPFLQSADTCEACDHAWGKPFIWDRIAEKIILMRICERCGFEQEGIATGSFAATEKEFG